MTSNQGIEIWVTDKNGARFDKLTDGVVDKIKFAHQGDDSAQISYLPLDPEAASVKLVEREIQIWVNGDLVWWGVPRNRNGDVSKIVQPIESIASYLKYRWVLTETLTNTAIDQITIAAGFIAYAQNPAKQGTNADLNLSVGSADPSGFVGDFVYQQDQNVNIFDALCEFANYIEGFTWDIQFTPDGNRFWVPHLYSEVIQVENPLEYGREIIDYEWEEDASNLITKMRMTGGTIPQEDGSPSVKLMVDHEDVPASTQFGVHTNVVANGTELDEDLLQAQAEQGVAIRKQPIIITSVTVGNDKFDIFEEGVEVGHWVQTVIKHGIIYVAGWQRILEMEWTPLTTKLVFAQGAS